MKPPVPYWSDDRISLYLGDCLDVMRQMPDASVDSVVTDPPAGVSFMGRSWDGDRGGRDRWIGWLAERMAEALRVLKPGGHALVWALPRTSGWTQMALEDAGFEAREAIVHIFGSGFPKSLDVAAAIDRSRDDGAARRAVGAWLRARREAAGLRQKDIAAHWPSASGGVTGCVANWELGLGMPTWEQWQKLRELIGFGDEMDAEAWRLNGRKGTPGHERADRVTSAFGRDVYSPAVDVEFAGTPVLADAARWQGWGTSLKPGQEIWWLARKPLAGTVAATVLEHGTGALNIDGCRVDNGTHIASAGGSRRSGGIMGESSPLGGWESAQAGRWPANVVFTHSAACLTSDEDEADWCAPDCPVAELDRQSGVTAEKARVLNRNGARQMDGWGLGAESKGTVHGGSGGASRFFNTFRYQAKAPASERPRGEDGRGHECVKPLGLIRHHVRLITPPGGTVLDLFAGSGPVAEACIVEGFRCVLIEEDPHSAELIRTRLRKDIQPDLFGAAS